MRRFLPSFYVEGFADPGHSIDGSPAVWVHRTAIGEFKRARVEPDGTNRHFNEMPGPPLQGDDDLEVLLEAIEGEAARLIGEKLPTRTALVPAEREVLASFFALLGIRLSSRFADLDAAEAHQGYDQLLSLLRDMGWVFWEAEPPDYFVSSNAPFHVAFPKEDLLVQGMELHASGVEITLPLTPCLALHATWKRRGELWRRATEDVLLEVNARTLLRARKFVLAPKPAIPG